ncbi:MAG: type II toxin-antitoxin system HicA family toxin [Bacteroidota bacterium]
MVGISRSRHIDVSGEELVQKIKNLGYVKTRQSGSHIQSATEIKGNDHITISNHSLLKIGLYTKTVQLRLVLRGFQCETNCELQIQIAELMGTEMLLFLEFPHPVLRILIQRHIHFASLLHCDFVFSLVIA